MAYINLQHPLQARRWLRLLVEDSSCGFRLRPNLDISKKALGFSMRSNHLGLRGPANEQADRVIFGTSYAMGIAVNNGENWYDLCLNSNKWLNLGLAVGISEWEDLLKKHHHGNSEFAMLIYHPNIWVHCEMYERWRASGQGVFAALRWKTELWRCIWLTSRRFINRRKQRLRGNWLSVQHFNECYEIDLQYAYLDVDRLSENIDRHLNRLVQLLQPFRKILVVRIPVKQELVPSNLHTKQLLQLTANYDALWNRTQISLSNLSGIEFESPAIFQLNHYHPQDTHWNAAGNSAFAQWLQQRLGNCQNH